MNNYIIELIIYLIIFLFSAEIILQALVSWLKISFQWLITKKDEFPINNQNEIDQFIKKISLKILAGTEKLTQKDLNI